MKIIEILKRKTSVSRITFQYQGIIMKIVDVIKIVNRDHRILVLEPKQNDVKEDFIRFILPDSMMILDFKVDLDECRCYFAHTRKKIKLDKLESLTDGRCYIQYI